jgi:hypothetical protein
MKRPSSHITGDVAQTQLTTALQLAGCSVGPVLPDYGEDLAVELPEVGDLAGARLLIQVKGTRQKIVPYRRRVRLATITAAHVDKWANTILPVAVVRWNIDAEAGYYTFVNTPGSPLGNTQPDRKITTLFTSYRKRVSRRGASMFVRDALQAHRMNLELMQWLGDLEGGGGPAPVGIVQRNAEILVSIGLVQRVQSHDQEVAYSVSNKTRDRYILIIEELSREHPSWYAHDVVRRAAVVLVHRALGLHGPSAERLTISCFTVLWPMLGDHEGISEIVAEWGHPTEEK